MSLLIDDAGAAEREERSVLPDAGDLPRIPASEAHAVDRSCAPDVARVDDLVARRCPGKSGGGVVLAEREAPRLPPGERLDPDVQIAPAGRAGAQEGQILAVG